MADAFVRPPFTTEARSHREIRRNERHGFGCAFLVRIEPDRRRSGSQQSLELLSGFWFLETSRVVPGFPTDFLNRRS